MKALLTTAGLLAGITFALAQPAAPPQPGAELEVGYVRETFKARDQQVSPVLYIASLNGIRVAYTRKTPRNQWYVGTQFGTGDYLAPRLGIRSFDFTPDDPQDPLLPLAAKLYRGHLQWEYRRLIRQNKLQSTWLGVGIHQTFGYADGVSMTTWAFHSAAAILLYQTQWQLASRHLLQLHASLPVVAAVTRLPYSNVVSDPGRSNTRAFFGNTRLAALGRYLNPEASVAYRYNLSKRVDLRASYQYGWLRYPSPRVIRTASHAGNVSVVYRFQFQSR